MLVVSQFTLLGDIDKGRHPSFVAAACGDLAEALFRCVTVELRGAGIPMETGVFGADMSVELVNDGPVTIPLGTRRAF